MKNWLIVKLTKAQIEIKNLRKDNQEYKRLEQKYIDEMNVLRTEIRTLRLENERLKNERVINEKKQIKK